MPPKKKKTQATERISVDVNNNDNLLCRYLDFSCENQRINSVSFS